jgi:hypothetical protein
MTRCLLTEEQYFGKIHVARMGFVFPNKKEVGSAV